MKLEIARLIHKEFHTYAQEAINAYVQDRIESLYKELETVSKEELQKLQGAILELKKISKIKESALKILESEKRNGKT